MKWQKVNQLNQFNFVFLSPSGPFLISNFFLAHTLLEVFSIKTSIFKLCPLLTIDFELNM